MFPSLLRCSPEGHDEQRICCRGRYEVIIPADLFRDAVGDATIQLPLPEGGHPQLRVQPFRPPSVMYFHLGHHLVYSWPVGATADDVVVGYDFSCQLGQVGGDATAVPEELERHRVPDLPPAYVEKARDLLGKILTSRLTASHTTAKAIYAWVLDNYTFREVISPSLQVFDTGVGPCTHATKLFVELCRLAGLPARARCGALLQRVVSVGRLARLESIERGHSPFVHTWAEFHDSSRGWVPVEFLGWMLGERTLTTRNATDRSFRRHIQKQTERFDGYYFGHIDPFRIRSTTSASGLRAFPTLRRQTNWRGIYRALLETRHRLSCTITNSMATSDIQVAEHSLPIEREA